MMISDHLLEVSWWFGHRSSSYDNLPERSRPNTNLRVNISETEIDFWKIKKSLCRACSIDATYRVWWQSVKRFRRRCQKCVFQTFQDISKTFQTDLEGPWGKFVEQVHPIMWTQLAWKSGKRRGSYGLSKFEILTSNYSATFRPIQKIFLEHLVTTNIYHWAKSQVSAMYQLTGICIEADRENKNKP